MAFCSGCGTAIPDGSAFCAKCGKPAATAAGSGAAAAPAPAQSAPAAAPASGLQDNIAGLLCYSPVGLIADIVFLVTEPYKSNKFVRFHAFQSLFLAAACFALGIVLGIVNAVVGMIVAPLVLVLGLIEMVLWLGVMVLWVMMMVKAYNNTTPHLPVIGDMAQKQADAA